MSNIRKQIPYFINKINNKFTKYIIENEFIIQINVIKALGYEIDLQYPCIINDSIIKNEIEYINFYNKIEKKTNFKEFIVFNKPNANNVQYIVTFPGFINNVKYLYKQHFIQELHTNFNKNQIKQPMLLRNNKIIFIKIWSKKK